MPNDFKIRNGLIVDSGGATITGSITARQTGFNASGIFTGETLGGIALTTTSSNGFSIFTLGGALQIYDNTNAATRFTLAAGGGITANSFTGSLQGALSSRYICQAYLNSNQSIPTDADTVVRFVDDIDPNNWYNDGTYRFTPTIAGYYSISAAAWLSTANATTNQFNFQCRKNGNQIIIVQCPLPNDVGQSLTFTRMVYMNGSGDYLDFTIYQGAGIDVDLNGGNGTWFTAHLIST